MIYIITVLSSYFPVTLVLLCNWNNECPIMWESILGKRKESVIVIRSLSTTKTEKCQQIMKLLLFINDFCYGLLTYD